MSRDRPWLDEPDHDEFISHGLQCVMHRDPHFKSWCGYVGVPETHTLFGVSFHDHIPYPDVWRERAINLDEQGVINTIIALFDPDEVPTGFAPFSMVFGVHGGMSFSEPRREFPHLWFFGFDCSHAGDYAPGMHEVLEDFPTLAAHHLQGVYRSFDYVRGECTQLAAQLSEYVPSEGTEDALKALQQKASRHIE